MEQHAEKVALVTGASSGIGEAAAWALATHGIRVAVAARRADRLASLVERIHKAGGQALALEIDVTDEQQVQTMVRRTQEEWGRLDILVNNAGLMLLGPIAGADTEDWRRMVSINVLGLLYATQRNPYSSNGTRSLMHHERGQTIHPRPYLSSDKTWAPKSLHCWTIN